MRRILRGKKKVGMGLLVQFLFNVSCLDTAIPTSMVSMVFGIAITTSLYKYKFMYYNFEVGAESLWKFLS